MKCNLCHVSFQSFLKPIFVFSAAKYYVKVMQKIQDKGEGYAANELQRLDRMLGKCFIVWNSASSADKFFQFTVSATCGVLKGEFRRDQLLSKLIANR